MNPFDAFISGIWLALEPNLGWIISLVVVGIILVFPLPGRGPNSSRRDVWRGFKYDVRDTVIQWAGRRCEAAAFLVWGRCAADAVDVDHIMRWSRGGPTVVSNGQGLCRGHNRGKGSTNPPWWYILRLERSRRRYYPAAVDVRVFAVTNEQGRVARARWSRNRARR